MRRVLIGLIAVLALFGAACGGDDDDATKPATTGDEDGGGGGEASSEFCGVIEEFKTFVEGVDGTLSPIDATTLDDIVDRAKATAPDELGELDSYFDATLVFFTSDDGGANLTADQQAAYEAQGEALRDYAADTCGIEDTAGG